MTSYLEENCEFVEWSSLLVTSCPEYSCSRDRSIENFFKTEFENYNNQLLGKSYGFVKTNPSLELVAAFTVANSMLPVVSFPKNVKNRINRKIPNYKRNSQYPAVLVGQLAVFDAFSGKQIGNEVLSFIKSWC